MVNMIVRICNKLRRIILIHLDQELPGFIIGKSQNIIWMDFGPSERVHEPRKQDYLALETPGYLKQFKKIQNDA